jgi:hypothetical protein
MGISGPCSGFWAAIRVRDSCWDVPYILTDFNATYRWLCHLGHRRRCPSERRRERIDTLAARLYARRTVGSAEPGV